MCRVTIRNLSQSVLRNFNFPSGPGEGGRGDAYCSAPDANYLAFMYLAEVLYVPVVYKNV